MLLRVITAIQHTLFLWCMASVGYNTTILYGMIQYNMIKYHGCSNNSTHHFSTIVILALHYNKPAHVMLKHAVEYFQHCF